ncbi:L-dopachrome tautomerase-related protein [Pseudomonas baetica]|uniref:L-dopachrome tautomerase-related protein n=1 Tax=Pseudomonas baetica TaxID=674054 RepID=UPI00287199C0|nr:L-dopachrome tautomerase-related protein [Pseudomonas baetica]MDR9865768.1 L-dopachrome tautomerase-related protein [Pseudomonas baetica]
MKRTVAIYLLILFSPFSNASSDSYAHHSKELIAVADLGRLRAVGLGVSSDNRIFVSFPNRIASNDYAVAEVVGGKLLAYPDTAWNTNVGDERKRFVNAQALHVDARDNLWVLDSKPVSGPVVEQESKNSAEGYFKLVKINLSTNRVEKEYYFDSLDKRFSSLNDVNVDIERGVAYLSDPGLKAIVVLDLITGTSRTLLRDSFATKADPNVVLSYEGQPMQSPDGTLFKSDVNGIALTKDNRYLYFKPINKVNLYRIETRSLVDTRLDDIELASKVEDQGATTVSHGLIADAQDNIYMTSSLDYSVKYKTPGDGLLHTLVQDARLIWPDSLGVGNDGYLYITAAQYQRDPYWNNGREGTVYPYQLYKVRLPQ